jgi:anthranilate/para-aminobenzoate synthase component II
VRVRTLLIDNYDSFSYNLANYLGEVNGAEPTVVRNDEPGWRPEFLEEFDNVVISPGPGTPGVPADFGICRRGLVHPVHLARAGVGRRRAARTCRPLPRLGSRPDTVAW